MDIEVRKAYRTLQRAGITTMCLDSSLEDFPKEYGTFLLQWIRNQGIPCSVLRVTSKVRYGHGTLSSVMDKFARVFLQEYCQGEVKINDHYQFRSDSFYEASMKTEADDTKIMTTYLAHLSPNDVVKKISSANDRILGIFPGFTKGNQPLLLFFAIDDGDEQIEVHGYLYFYTMLSVEEIAKAEETRKKREETAAKAAEKRQKTKEAKDKKTLQQLLAKYGRDNE